MTDPGPARDLQAAVQEADATDGQLVEIMGELARWLHRDHNDLDSVLSTICEAARTGIPGARDAGITLFINRHEFESHGATGELPAVIDKLQEKIKQGPCVDAARDADVVRVNNMNTETRWPRFSPAAALAGVGSMLSFQLWVEREHIGALNLYATEADAFEPTSEEIGRPLAAHASVAISAARREHQLREALHNRDVIGQAKGMLMQRYSIDADKAFELLTRLSQESNLKARDIAERITTRGLD